MVPEGWRADIIGNHISIVSGYPFKSHEYTDNSDGIRLLRGDNIAQGYIRWSGCQDGDKRSLYLSHFYA